MPKKDRDALREELDRMGDADSPMETGVSIMPNLSLETASSAVAQEQPLVPSTDPSTNETNGAGPIVSM